MNIAVIGANRGIGLEFCRQYSKNNTVFAFCREASDDLNSVGVEQVIEGCEVTSLDSLTAAASKLNTDKLDLLIHVSGVLSSQSLEDFDVDEIKKQFEVNSIGPILSYKAFANFLKPGSKFSVLSSRMGSVADNSSGGQYGYRMSKAAINMAAVSLANDLKESGVAVIILHPGYVRTDMTGGNGMIDTDESVSGMIKILAEKNINETGTFWHTNGEQLPW